MKRNLLFTLLLVCATILNVAAQQPMGGCWHPEDIKNWTPQSDPEAKFNRSVVPLKERFIDKTTKAGPYNYYDSQVTACLTMNPMCSQTPSQGANSFTGYTFNYWQYVDILVWWGGSAGEGVIIPPSAPVVDAAHKNGVQVYGNVFFPPGAFGGQRSWVREMLTVENGEYPFAKKLAEIANYYGFDGWFVNEETYASSKDEWAAFAQTFNKYKGSSHMGLQWYDASTSITGSLFEGKDKFSSMFLNYGSANSGSITSNNNKAKSWGMNPFAVNFYGLEIGGGGFYHKREFTALYSKDKNNGSVALFCPEEKTWKDHTKKNELTPYEQMEEFYKTASRFWVNINHDVTSKSAYDDSNWPGMSVGVAARSVINEFPFVTSFNTGMGKKRYVKGVAKGTGDWYHRGIQSILPTWRWWVEGTKKTITPKFSWDDSYNSGASLALSGDLDANVSNNVRLYKTHLTVTGSEHAKIVVKGVKTGYSCYLGLAFSEDNNAFTYIPMNSFANGNWKTYDIPLKTYRGKTISMVSFKLVSATNVKGVDLKIGQIYLGDAVPACGNATDVKIINDKGVVKTSLGDTKGNARIVWNAATGVVSHYNIYMEQGGKEQLVGQTMDDAFYVDDITRTNSSELSIKFKIKSVDLDGNETAGVVKVAEWEKPQAPSVKIVSDKSYIEAGETVVFTARATQYPESYKWTIPAGAEKVNGSYKANQIACRFSNTGVYNISVKVTNSVGATTETLNNAVKVVAKSLLEVVSVGKTIDSFSDCISKHHPRCIIDGEDIPSSLDNKWCVGGSKSQWVIIDLEEPYDIYGFRAFDTGHKEDPSGNYDCWKIEVSNDKQTWTEVVDEQGRKSENTKVDAIPGIIGRYVRFTPYDKDLNITIRIWEFQVLGVSMGMNLSQIDNIKMSSDETKTVKVTYDLGAIAKAKDFGFNITSEDDNILVTNEVIDEKNNTFQFDMSAKKGFYGNENVSVSFTNGGFSKDVSFDVMVKSANWTNVLVGKKLQAYKSDYGWNQLGDKIDGAATLVDNNQETGINTKYMGVILEADLKDVHTLSCFKYTGSQDGETLKIKVYGSNDGENYDLVVLNENYKGGSLFILEKAVSYRFIRIWSSVSGWASVTINEMVALGEVKDFSFSKVKKQTLHFDQTRSIQIPFTNKVDFNSDEVSAKVSNTSFARVTNVTVDKAKHIINVTLQSNHLIGATNVELEINHNGRSYVENIDLVVTPKDAINVALNKQVVDHSGSTPNELPSFLFDGETSPESASSKWCETGDGPHYVVVDLEKVYSVYEFKMFDSGNKEDANWNSVGYTIEVSEDNKTWTTIAESATDDSTTKDIFTNGVKARYVKYTTGGDNGNGTIRLFEFEIYGTKDLSTPVITSSAALISVYPNPTTDFIEVKGVGITTETTVELFDLLGQLERSIPNYSGQKIDMTGLTKGVHIVRIKTGDSITYTKIMVL
ncbi:discoidin domain-containing protein [Prolixibacteraceae bacterium]|nr:discoidin domain-containing protein [Prolixibacteraceae bacterium]